jgi:hypothetical protein
MLGLAAPGAGQSLPFDRGQRLALAKAFLLIVVSVWRWPNPSF